MNKYIVSFLVLSLLAFELYAQDDSSIVVNRDSRIDSLLAKREMFKPVGKKSSGIQKGYRIQVINTRVREEAMNAKATLLREFDNQKSYLIFQSPYFKVRIGNFSSREDANKFKSLLLRKYPGAYIVEDLIEYKGSNDNSSK